jgi:hypothetical protein
MNFFKDEFTNRYNEKVTHLYELIDVLNDVITKEILIRTKRIFTAVYFRRTNPFTVKYKNLDIRIPYELLKNKAEPNKLVEFVSENWSSLLKLATCNMYPNEIRLIESDYCGDLFPEINRESMEGYFKLCNIDIEDIEAYNGYILEKVKLIQLTSLESYRIEHPKEYAKLITIPQLLREK